MPKKLKTGNRPITFSMNDYYIERLRAYAQHRGINMSEALRHAIDDIIAKGDKQQKKRA